MTVLAGPHGPGSDPWSSYVPPCSGGGLWRRSPLTWSAACVHRRHARTLVLRDHLTVPARDRSAGHRFLHRGRRLAGRVRPGQHRHAGQVPPDRPLGSTPRATPAVGRVGRRAAGDRARRSIWHQRNTHLRRLVRGRRAHRCPAGTVHARAVGGADPGSSRSTTCLQPGRGSRRSSVHPRSPPRRA